MELILKIIIGFSVGFFIGRYFNEIKQFFNSIKNKK